MTKYSSAMLRSQWNKFVAAMTLAILVLRIIGDQGLIKRVLESPKDILIFSVNLLASGIVLGTGAFLIWYVIKRKKGD